MKLTPENAGQNTCNEKGVGISGAAAFLKPIVATVGNPGLVGAPVAAVGRPACPGVYLGGRSGLQGGPGGPRAAAVLAAIASYLKGKSGRKRAAVAPDSTMRLGGTLPLAGVFGDSSSPERIKRAVEAAEPAPGAERKMGAMLAATPRAKGADVAGRKRIDGKRRTPSNPPPTLSSLGITKREAAERRSLPRRGRAAAPAIFADPRRPPDRRWPCTMENDWRITSNPDFSRKDDL
jgi:hypothetical protein